MESGKTVLFEKKNEHVALVTLNRPQALNAFNTQLIDDLDATVGLIAEDSELRVVIFTGAGEKAFVSGADIKEFKTRTPVTGFQISRRRQGLFRRVETLPQTTIAAVNGYAFGGGCEFAMACTLRVASSKAKLGQLEVNLGIIPGAGGTQRLPRLVGKGRALDIILTAKVVDAEEALRIGLVDRVVPHEKLLEEAMSMATVIAGKAPIAVRLARKAVEASFDASLEDGTALESSLLSICFASEDFREGVAAFEEKRAPEFRNK